MLTYKQKDLCSFLGSQRTTIISTLDRLSDEGMVEYDSKELRFLDFNRLLGYFYE